MKHFSIILCLVLVYTTLVSGIVVYNTTNWHELVLSHVHAAFGPNLSQYNVTVAPMLAPDLLCDDSSLDGLDFSDHVVLVPRGECSFYDKVMRAQQHNARAVVVGNIDDSLIIMGGNSAVDEVVIHAVLVRASVFAYLRQHASAPPTPQTSTIDLTGSTSASPATSPALGGVSRAANVSRALRLAADEPLILIAVTHVGGLIPDFLPWDTMRLAALFSLIIPAVVIVVLCVRVLARVWRQRVVRHLTVDVGQALPICIYIAGDDAPVWAPIARVLVREDARARGSTDGDESDGKGPTVAPSLSPLAPRGYSTLEDAEAVLPDAAGQRAPPVDSSAGVTVALLDTVLAHLTEILPASWRARSLVSVCPLPPVRAVAASTIPQLDAVQASTSLGSGPLPLPRVPSGENIPCQHVHGSTCSVCLEDFTTGDRVKVLPCKHAYHPQCIDEWLSSSNNDAYRPNLTGQYDQSYTLDVPTPGTAQTTERVGSATVHGNGGHCCPVCKASVLAGMERERWEHAPWWVKLYRVVCACEPCSRHVQAQ